MYKLVLELKDGCLLSFEPQKSHEVEKIFMHSTYWYLQSQAGRRFLSLNISSSKILDHLKRKLLPKGYVFAEFSVNNNDVCYVYSGILNSNRITESLGLRPLFAGDEHLTYFFTDEDFKNNICPHIGEYVRNILAVKNNGPTYALDADLEVLKEIKQIPPSDIDANLDLYRKFFEIYCGYKCVKIDLSHLPVEQCKYCTAKVGLNFFLHIVKLVPLDTWIKEYHRNLMIDLLHQDFLVDWIDINKLDEARQKRILSKTRELVPMIKTVQDLKKEVDDLVKSMVERQEIFKILYFLAMYDGFKATYGEGSTSIKRLFVNLFSLLPKERKKYLFYPKFQPKLLIDGIELHFIIGSTIEDVKLEEFQISQMDRALKDIFDETKFLKLEWIEVYPPPLRSRYRFMCGVKKGGYQIDIDYTDFPDLISDTLSAISTIAKRNKLIFNLEEAWMKKISVKIETPPQFEYAVMDAFGSKWCGVLRGKKVGVIKTHLFDIDIGLKGDLEKGFVPDRLKNELKARGFLISEKSDVWNEKDNKWTITDNNNIFFINEENGKLNIYKILKGEVLSSDFFFDYPSLKSREFKLKYLRDVQSIYAALNKRLEKDFNFKMIHLGDQKPKIPNN